MRPFWNKQYFGWRFSYLDYFRNLGIKTSSTWHCKICNFSCHAFNCNCGCNLSYCADCLTNHLNITINSLLCNSLNDWKKSNQNQKADLLNELSYLNIREIAEIINVSHSTLYRFKNKMEATA